MMLLADRDVAIEPAQIDMATAVTLLTPKAVEPAV
jgi:hypothetical protein